ncbi:MAG: hypothetical protein IJW19_04330 [Clostridia bacterium]|nr:hypothetical protein [Clostridia bacterium]
MPVWVYIVGGILLFLALLLSLKVNIIVSYRQELRVYLRILFVRIRLFPQKLKYKEKKKVKKKKTDTKNKDVIENEGQKDNSPVKVIWEIREAILKLSKKAMGALHFKFAKLNIEVGCSDATKTALVYGATVQGVAYLVEILDNISNVEISRFSKINICSNFISQKSRAEAKITLYIRVFSAFKVLVHLLKTYFIYNNKKEKLSEDKNGKNESE